MTAVALAGNALALALPTTLTLIARTFYLAEIALAHAHDLARTSLALALSTTLTLIAMPLLMILISPVLPLPLMKSVT